MKKIIICALIAILAITFTCVCFYFWFTSVVYAHELMESGQKFYIGDLAAFVELYNINKYLAPWCFLLFVISWFSPAVSLCMIDEIRFELKRNK